MALFNRQDKLADDGTLDEEDNKNLEEKIRRNRDYAPSTRIQTESYKYFVENSQSMMGAPYDVSRIPIDVLTQMKFDPSIAFAEHFITMPLLRARWHIECEDGQVAAFVDSALRRIYSSYILERSQAHFYGFKPIVKRYQLEFPDWKYLDPAKSDTTIKVWDSKNVEAKVFKHFVGLPSDPDICQPIFNSKGEFNGIEYTPPAGAISSFPFTKPLNNNSNTVTTKKIPAHLSLWTTNQRQTVDGCSPPDELILTSHHGYVPISELDPDKHELAQFSSGKILRFNRKNGQGGHRFEVGSREYKGDLITINTPNGVTRVTPNHKLTVKWQEEIGNKYAVYIMSKKSDDGDDKYRIGISKVSRTKAKQRTSGVLHRMFKEQADEGWIVDIFDTKQEAIFAEQKWSYQYNIPDLTFKVKNHVLTQEQHDGLWDEIKNTEEGAINLLADQGRDINYPLYRKHKNPKGGRGEFTVAACNLFEQMRIPTDPGVGQKAEWHDIKLDRENYEGLVYSLEVPPYNHYISNGNITQNSLWGFPRTGYAYRYWFSYWLRWAQYDRYFERKSDPPYVVYYPTDPEGGTSDAEGNNMKTHALAVGDAAKAGGTIALPGDFVTDWEGKPTNHREWDIKELEIQGSLDNFDESFKELEVKKIMALLVPHNALTGGEGGATNSAEHAFNIFKQSEASEMEQIDDEINRFIIPDLIAANFPDRDVTAKKVTTGFDDADLDTMMEIIRVVGQSDQNALKAVDFQGMLDTIGIPSINHDELVRREEKIKEEIANATPEPLQPIPGEQAGVDEEGFYVQPREKIALAEDTSFISKLPPTKHYEDEKVLSDARKIRAKWNVAYKDIYEDFATFIQNSDITNLQDMFVDEMFAESLELDAKLVPNKPHVKNWIEKKGGLPKYIADIAGDLITERGFSVSHAIATAVSKCKEWCAKGNAKACKAIAQWEKMKIHAAEENLIEINLDEDEVSKLAYRIVSRWNYSRNKTKKLTQETKDLIKEVIARAGSRELQRIRTTGNWKPDTDSVAAYLEERGSLYVDAIDETVKDELGSFIANEIRSGKSNEQIAQAVREHFSDFPSWKADRLVRSEVRDAYNFATLEAGQQAGVKVVQAKDAQYGDTDEECMNRDGQFFSIPKALTETLREHPNGTLEWKLIPDIQSVNEITVEASELDDGEVAYFDDDTNTIVLSNEATEEEIKEFKTLLGDVLTT